MSAAPEATMRRGACPALSAPMQTGDGLLVRLNLAEGGMTPGELAALCGLAADHGNGIVEVTARGSFQIRGLTPASAPLLEAEVAALGLPLREGVPVEASPLASLDPAEVADPLPLVRAIRAAIADAGLPGRLGPKVSVVVDAGGAVDLSDILADVRLTAARQDEAVSWHLAIGGNVRTARPLAVLDEHDAVAAVVTVLEAIAARGMSARARDLAPAEMKASFSPSTLRSFAPPSVLPDISPTGGEIGLLLTSLSSCEVDEWRQPLRQQISPLVGEMSGRTEGGNVERRTLTELNALQLTDGRFAASVGLPFGSTHAGELATFLDAIETNEIRLAPQRSLILICGTENAVRAASETARRAGLILDPADPRRTIAACPGAPACASGRIATRDLARRLAARGDLPGSVHVSGCAKGCAHPSPARLVLVGTDAGVALVRDGRAGDAPEMIFPDADAALAALAALPEPAE